MSEIEAQPAEISGEACVIRAKPAVFTATIQVTRAATGKVEEYNVTGYADEPQGDISSQ
jgi:hypothetical protein